MEEEGSASPHRLSDPLSRLSDVPGSSCSSWSGSNPGSPRLPPRRASQSPPLHRASVDWQERCMELQMELHRYRHQAANVRDMLKDKEEPTGLNIVPKSGWGAMEPKKTEPLATPVDYVLLKYHSKTQECVVPAQCRMLLRNVQKYQICMLDYDDIEYNFYIAGDGNVYEGRGWTNVPSREHNLVGSALYIVYMGDFDTSHDPPDYMRNNYEELIKFGIENNYIKKDFYLYELRLDDTILRDYKGPNQKKHPHRNFYIAGDGNVYEGRGWTNVPSREHNLVRSALYIVYIGDFYTSYDPPDYMRNSYEDLIKFGIQNNYIKKDFQLYELRLTGTLLRDYQRPKQRKHPHPK